MKKIIYTIILVLTLTSNTSRSESFDYTVINGEWGAYKDNLIKDDWFSYLRIGDNGGKFLYSYGCEPYAYNFKQSQITQVGGLLFIELSKSNKGSMRLVISAFRTKSGSALLTGSLYMFKVDDGIENLFNTIPQRMSDLESDINLKENIHNAMSENKKEC